MMRLNSGSRIRGAQALTAGASGRVHVNPFQVRISVVVCLFSLSSLHFQLDAEQNQRSCGAQSCHMHAFAG